MNRANDVKSYSNLPCRIDRQFPRPRDLFQVCYAPRGFGRRNIGTCRLGIAGAGILVGRFKVYAADLHNICSVDSAPVCNLLERPRDECRSLALGRDSCLAVRRQALGTSRSSFWAMCVRRCHRHPCAPRAWPRLHQIRSGVVHAARCSWATETGGAAARYCRQAAPFSIETVPRPKSEEEEVGPAGHCEFSLSSSGTCRRASLFAQVHRATIAEDPEDVAVKCSAPGIEKALSQEMSMPFYLWRRVW